MQAFESRQGRKRKNNMKHTVWGKIVSLTLTVLMTAAMAAPLPVNAGGAVEVTVKNMGDAGGNSFSIYANGIPILLAAGAGDKTKIYLDVNANGQIDAGENPLALSGADIPAGSAADGYDLTRSTVFGGGCDINALSTKVSMLGGKIAILHGGGAKNTGTGGEVTGNTSVTVLGGEITDRLSGGGYAGGTVHGDSSVVIRGSSAVIGMLLGCGYSAVIDGNSYITIADRNYTQDICCTYGMISGDAIIRSGINGKITSQITGEVLGYVRYEYEVAFFDGKNGNRYSETTPQKTQWIRANNLIEKPTDPTLNEKNFAGWRNMSDDSAFSLGTAITAPLALYAEWTDGETQTLYLNTTDGKLHVGSTDGEILPSESSRLCGGAYSWDAGTQTLTLNNVNWKTTAATAFNLGSTAVTLALADYSRNSFASTCISNTLNAESCGIYVGDSLTVTGELDVSSRGKLSVEGTSFLTPTPDGLSNTKTIGIFVKKNYIQTGGDVEAFGGSIIGSNPGGTSSGLEFYPNPQYSATITGGTLRARGGRATSKSNGIFTYGNIVVDGGGLIGEAVGCINVNAEKALCAGIVLNQGIFPNRLTFKKGSMIGVGARAGISVGSYELPELYQYKVNPDFAEEPGVDYIQSEDKPLSLDDASYKYVGIWEVVKEGTAVVDVQYTGERTFEEPLTVWLYQGGVEKYTMRLDRGSPPYFVEAAYGTYDIWTNINGTPENSGEKITVDSSKTERSLTFYRVQFKNGSDTLKSGYAASDHGITPPANPTKSGQTFDGWDKDYTSITADTIITAKWSASTGGTVRGTVTNDKTPPEKVGGVTVIVKRGETELGKTTTDADGGFGFSGLPDGTYCLVAVKGEQTVTKMIAILKNAANGDMVLPTGRKNTIVETRSNTPPIAAEGLNGLFTADDLNAVSMGGKVEIKLTAEKKDESAVPADAGKLKILTGDGKELVLIDLTVKKTVNGGGSTTLKELDKIIEIVVELPEELKDKTGLSVFRVHNDIAEALSTDETKGEYYKIEGNYLHIFVKKFSTYAIAFDKTGGSGSGGNSLGTSGGSGSSDSPSSGSGTPGKPAVDLAGGSPYEDSAKIVTAQHSSGKTSENAIHTEPVDNMRQLVGEAVLLVLAGVVLFRRLRSWFASSQK